MAEFYFDNLAKNLPDAYKKDSSSNNFKILEIERDANGVLRNTLDEIAAILDIEQVSGTMLDMYGKKVGQARGKATDVQYRAMIKSKIARCYCDGGYKNIIDALCYTFGCTKDEVRIVETDTPMTVLLDKAPLNAIIKAGFSTGQAEQIIKSILPTTITLDSVLFEGTFEFGENENEYDESKGFGETVNGAIGGYLGWTNSQESIDKLPI